MVGVMILLSTKGKIKKEDDKSHIKIKFAVGENINSLIVNFEYSPKTLEDREAAAAAVRSCFFNYDERMPLRPFDYLPVKNLVTLSVDENGAYRGAAHRQANSQKHIIGRHFASPGFIKGSITPGEWDIVLSVHCANCDMDYTLTVEGEELK